MYDFVYRSVRRSVRDSHWSRDYRDGTGIRVFYENPGFYKLYLLEGHNCLSIVTSTPIKQGWWIARGA
jgi:hypothetical protein